jgi:hypothetical protein
MVAIHNPCNLKSKSEDESIPNTSSSNGNDDDVKKKNEYFEKRGKNCFYRDYGNPILTQSLSCQSRKDG